MFKTGKVLYYKNDNSTNTIQDLQNLIQTYKLENNKFKFFPESLNKNDEEEKIYRFVLNMPIGTIISRILNKNSENLIAVCYPMFSLHVSLPVKPGEVIWLYEDSNENMLEKDIADKIHSLNIKHYWLSRKIGSMFSEDLNFTNIQADSLLDDEVFNDEDLKYPDLDDKKHFDYSFMENFRQPSVKSLYSEGIASESIVPKIAPRWHSKAHELSLQGSNNTLINLTTPTSSSDYNSFFKKNSGAIDLVAGRHSLYFFDDQEESNYHKLDEEVSVEDFVDEFDNFDLESFIDNTIDKNSPITLIKNLDYSEAYPYELLKSNSFYLENFSNIMENSESESTLNFDNDASRIYISEFEKNVDSSGDFYNSYYKDKQFMINRTSSSLGEVTTEKDFNAKDKLFFMQEKKLVIKNQSSFSIDSFERLSEREFDTTFDPEKINNDFTSPFILIKSNDIRIVSRKERSNKVTKSKISEGSISLIKESNNFDDYSCLSLEKDGNISLDSKEIYVGNIIKEYLKQGIFSLDNLENEDDFEDKINEIVNNLTYDDVSSMHGKGTGVLLGYDPKFSEPLVLGDTLKLFLTEILKINIEALTFISEAFLEIYTNFDKINADHTQISNWAKSHTHLSTIPITGAPGSPSVVVPAVTANPLIIKDNHSFSQTKQSSEINGGEEVDRINKLISNLDLILSRFSKTS